MENILGLRINWDKIMIWFYRYSILTHQYQTVLSLSARERERERERVILVFFMGDFIRGIDKDFQQVK